MDAKLINVTAYSPPAAKNEHLIYDGDTFLGSLRLIGYEAPKSLFQSIAFNEPGQGLTREQFDRMWLEHMVWAGLGH
ncbi:hypothetical protein LCGC14_1042340 [marine sediment metagenome]|uniref:Uncharacterized protein n=1 Tax=marine sediment metagenome TaxID=412755 RepID=A0A0F9QXM3_9ZZZZ